MRPSIADVALSVSLCVCQLVTHNHELVYAKTAEPIEMPFGVSTRPRHHVLGGVQDHPRKRTIFFGGGRLPAHCDAKYTGIHRRPLFFFFLGQRTNFIPTLPSHLPPLPSPFLPFPSPHLPSRSIPSTPPFRRPPKYS